MKKGFIVALLLNIILLVVYFQEDIISFITTKINKLEIKENTTLTYNKYSSSLINNITSITPTKKEDLKDIYYTIINSGMDKVTFYCHENYENCINDISEMSNNSKTIEVLNNYVHPYNSYKYLMTDIYGDEITVTIDKNYTEQMIEELNNKVELIISETITYEMTDKEKVKAIHDYIINNTRYDKTNNTYSHLAYGALIEGNAICGGYTDAMSIFLHRLNIPNYKINSEEHIWNYVKIDGNWYHLDLTWDDPVNEFKDFLTYDYFLITDDELKQKNDGEHNYQQEKLAN